MSEAPPPGTYYPPPKHPQATTVLVLGILGLVLCQVLGPFAWVMGNKAQKEIQAHPGAYSGDGEINAGRILGIISTALLGLMVLLFALMIVVSVGIFTTAATFG